MMRRLAPALALFFLAPLVGEFFLGDFPITYLPLILALAPLYGGGALLIREISRRTQRGWPTIVVLALAFGVFEEALLTQSLFNPDYAGVHLLDAGFVPALGIAIPWTIFVLTLHTVWSISTPIALVEESTARPRTQPWLGRTGLVVTALLFVAGSIFTFLTSYGQGQFLASPLQLGISAVVVAGLVVIALRVPQVPVQRRHREGRVPQPWLVFAISLVAGGVFMAGDSLPVWAGVPVVVLVLAAIIVLIGRWSACSGWGSWHRYALAAGAVLTYSWHAFATTPVIGGAPVVNMVSHVIYAVAALGILWFVTTRIRRHETSAVPDSLPQDWTETSRR